MECSLRRETLEKFLNRLVDNFEDAALFEFEASKGLRVETKNYQNTAMVVDRLPYIQLWGLLEKQRGHDVEKFCLDIKRLMNIVKSVPKNSLIKLVTTTDSMILSFGGSIESLKFYDISTIKKIKLPKISFDANIQNVNPKNFQEQLKSIKEYSTTVTFEIENGILYLHGCSEDEVRSGKREVGKNLGCSNIRSTYSIDLVYLLVNKLIKEEFLSIQFSKDMPMKIGWKTGYYLIAPRIESD